MGGDSEVVLFSLSSNPWAPGLRKVGVFPTSSVTIFLGVLPFFPSLRKLSEWGGRETGTLYDLAPNCCTLNEQNHGMGPLCASMVGSLVSWDDLSFIFLHSDTLPHLLSGIQLSL